MWMLAYVDAVKRKLIDEYGMPENPEKSGCVLGTTPDGVYPMFIEGKMDYVRIKDNRISCCNFEKPEGVELKRPRSGNVQA